MSKVFVVTADITRTLTTEVEIEAESEDAALVEFERRLYGGMLEDQLEEQETQTDLLEATEVGEA